MEQLQLSSLTEESSQVLQEPSLKDLPQHLAARGPGNIHPNRVTEGNTSGREILWREWRNEVIPYPPAGEAKLVMGALGWNISQLPVLDLQDSNATGRVCQLLAGRAALGLIFLFGAGPGMSVCPLAPVTVRVRRHHREESTGESHWQMLFACPAREQGIF